VRKPALKRGIGPEILPGVLKRSLPPHKCGGSLRYTLFIPLARPKAHGPSYEQPPRSRWKAQRRRSKLDRRTMRRSSFIAASIAAVLSAPLLPIAVLAQQSSQSVPEAPQPQAQKKPVPKPDSSSSTNDAGPGIRSKEVDPATAPSRDGKPSGKDDNPFPEDVSKAAAAKDAGNSSSNSNAQSGSDSGKSKDSSRPPTADDNPFPEAQSKAAATSANGGQQGSKNSTSDDNPFPEAQSKAAAKAAGNDVEPAAPAGHDLPPGVSSSRSTSLEDIEPATPGTVEPDPARAKKDTEVGGFYFKSGDYKGALLRFEDAMAYDPTNVDAIFGLAESQRMLKQNGEAARNYQLYLDILPNGPKSKQALKALKTLGSGG